MKIWLVGVSDCESNSIVCACSTKELAIKKMFLERDRLVSEWKERIKPEKEFFNLSKDDVERMNKMTIKMYIPMIKALSGDDYENWNNYPHDVPYISEIELLEEKSKVLG